MRRRERPRPDAARLPEKLRVFRYWQWLDPPLPEYPGPFDEAPVLWSDYCAARHRHREACAAWAVEPGIRQWGLTPGVKFGESDPPLPVEELVRARLR